MRVRSATDPLWGFASGALHHPIERIFQPPPSKRAKSDRNARRRSGDESLRSKIERWWRFAYKVALVVATTVLAATSSFPSPVQATVASARATAESASKPYLYPESGWIAVYHRAAAYYATETGVTLHLNPIFESVPANSGYDGHIFEEDTAAETFGEDGLLRQNTANPTVYCVILLNPDYATLDTIGHEVFHCLQIQILGNDAAFQKAIKSLGNWVIEGGAEYAGCRFANEDTTDRGVQTDEGNYAKWVATPGTPLLNRTNVNGLRSGYTAIGFWGLLQQAGINVFGVMPTVLTQPDAENAYSTAVAPNETAVLGLWASSLYRDLNRTPARDWDVSGPCAPALSVTKSNIKIDTKELRPGDTLTLNTRKYAAGLYDVDVAPGAKIMHVETMSGYTVVNGRDVNEVGVDDAYYCVAAGGCGCPPGQSYAGPPLHHDLAPSGPVPAIAVTGGTTGGEVDVNEIPVKCEKHAAAIPIPKGCPLTSAAASQAFGGPAVLEQSSDGNDGFPGCTYVRPGYVDDAAGVLVEPGSKENFQTYLKNGWTPVAGIGQAAAIDIGSNGTVGGSCVVLTKKSLAMISLRLASAPGDAGVIVLPSFSDMQALCADVAGNIA